MASHAVAAPVASRGPFRFPALVLFAVLVGVATSSMALWLITQNWLFFGLGVVSGVVSGVGLFHRSTGADTA